MPFLMHSSFSWQTADLDENEVTFALFESYENLEGDLEGGDMDLLQESMASEFVGLADDL